MFSKMFFICKSMFLTFMKIFIRETIKIPFCFSKLQSIMLWMFFAFCSI